MKDIINYEIFYSNKDFGKWQEENDVRVLAVSPILSNANTGDITDGSPLNIDMNIGVFVTYVKDNQNGN